MSINRTVAVILGGGQGTRLFPLTKERSKPAVPLAGKYRLIDIPISNCINSGIRMIYILTMYQSASLNSHISSAYRFDNFSKGFVETLAAEQTRAGGTWFRGTADAVRQAWRHLTDTPCPHVLILAGDHLYRMNYEDFFKCYQDSKSDLCIAVQPVTREDAPQLGLLKVDATGRVVKFSEKPTTPEALNEMMVDTTTLGLTKEEAEKKPFLASMGIYYFKTDVLGNLINKDMNQTDFGKHIIPACIDNIHVHAFCFKGYWADIGTVKAFYEANMDLVQPMPKFSLFDTNRPIYTNARYLPGSKVTWSSIENSMICDGVLLQGATVRNSIIGVRTRVRSCATIDSCIIMGADYYQLSAEEVPQIGIGENAYLKKSIIDKNVSIGRGVQLINRNNVENYDDPEERFYVRENILIVPKGAVLPEGLVF